MLSFFLFLFIVIIIFGIVGFCGNILLQAVNASAKLGDEVRKQSPETYQEVWSYRPFHPAYDRLNSFLKSNQLDDIPRIYAAKKRCQDTQAKARKLFLSFLSIMLLIVILGGLIATIQSG